MSCIISNFRPHQYLQRIFQSFRCISISFAPYFSFIHRPLHSTDIPLFTFLKGVWFASHQVCIERRNCKLVRSDGIGYLIFWFATPTCFFFSLSYSLYPYRYSIQPCFISSISPQCCIHTWMPSIALASGATSSMLTICTVKHVSSTNSIPASNYFFHTLDDKPFECTQHAKG